MSKYKYLVLSDLDGTLLNSKGELNNETIDYCTNTLNPRSDILFAFSTGRSWEDAKHIYESLQIKGLVSCCNGAHILDPKIDKHFYFFLDKKVCLQVLENCEFFTSLRSIKFCSNKGDFSIHHESDKSFVFEKVNSGEIGVLSIKIVLNLDVSLLNEKLRFLKTLAAPIIIFRYEKFNEFNLEIQAPGISKEHTVHFFSKHYSVDLKNILTYGDHVNDLSAARGDSYFTAVANALDIVKQEANNVSLLSNDQNAVVKEIDLYLKSKK